MPQARLEQVVRLSEVVQLTSPESARSLAGLLTALTEIWNNWLDVKSRKRDLNNGNNLIKFELPEACTRYCSTAKDYVKYNTLREIFIFFFRNNQISDTTNISLRSSFKGALTSYTGMHHDQHCVKKT